MDHPKENSLLMQSLQLDSREQDEFSRRSSHRSERNKYGSSRGKKRASGRHKETDQADYPQNHLNRNHHLPQNQNFKDQQNAVAYAMNLSKEDSSFSTENTSSSMIVSN